MLVPSVIGGLLFSSHFGGCLQQGGEQHCYLITLENLQSRRRWTDGQQHLHLCCTAPHCCFSVGGLSYPSPASRLSIYVLQDSDATVPPFLTCGWRPLKEKTPSERLTLCAPRGAGKPRPCQASRRYSWPKGGFPGPSPTPRSCRLSSLPCTSTGKEGHSGLGWLLNSSCARGERDAAVRKTRSFCPSSSVL